MAAALETDGGVESTQCIGTTAKGARCRKKSDPGFRTCHWHRAAEADAEERPAAVAVGDAPVRARCIGTLQNGHPCTRSAAEGFRTCGTHRKLEHFGDEVFALDLREPGISRKSEEVWRIRGDADLITNLPRKAVEAQKPEVDHVIEIQHHEWVFQRALHADDVPVAARTRSADVDVYKSLCNGADVLTVTTKRVNLAKKGPIQRFLRYQMDSLKGMSLGEIAREDAKPTLRAMIDDGSWDRLEKGIVSLWHDHIEPGVEERFENRATKTAVIDEMTGVLSRMKLE
jgi:hypothetical protein